MPSSTPEYVVKKLNGQYFYGGDKWGCCQRCAARYTQDEAHRLAHKGHWYDTKAVRLVKT